MRQKLLLIQPSPYDSHGRPIKKSRLYFVGLGLPLLAALTPPDWEIEIILETIEAIPFETDATLIGIGSMGHATRRSIDIAREFRRRGKTVVLGGYMVSLIPEEAKKHCDAVVIGDAEAVWPQLLDDFTSGKLQSFYQQKLTVLEPPLPRFDLIVTKKIGNFLPVQAGRGCPNSCSFCSVACLYQGVYMRRPVQDVLRDIRQVRELGFRRFLLLDDNILADREYMLELCGEIGKLGMEWLSQCSIQLGDDPELLAAVAASGCVALSFGLESITPASLAAMDKAWARPEDYPRLLHKIRKAGIDLSTEMVVGGEGDTLASIRQTADFIADNKIVVPRFYILTPIPGTKYYREMQEQGRLVNEDIYSYDGAQAVHQPNLLTPEELTQAYWELYNKVFSFASIMRRTIWRREFWRRPGKYIFYLLINLYYRRQIKARITPNII